MKSTMILGVAIIAAAMLIAGAWWMAAPVPHEAARAPPAVEEARQPVSAPSVAVKEARPEPAAALPAAVAVSSVVSEAPVAPPERQGEVRAVVAELDKLYAAPPPEITAEEAKDLMARRANAKQELVDRLAAMGAGGARAIGDIYKQTGVLRDRLLLAEALGKIADGEAVTVLGKLLAGERGFYERQEIIKALGRHPENAAVELLAVVVSNDQEGGLRFAAAQGLAGRAEALPILSAAIQKGTDPAVRQEAIRSVGLIRSEAAKSTLIGFAQEPALETILRQTAIQELRRSFGMEALPVLEGLSNDPDAAVGASATQAMAMLHSNSATPEE